MIAVLVLLPFLAAGLSVFLSRRASVAVLATALNLGLSVAVAIRVLAEGRQRFVVAGFLPGEIAYVADGLSILLVVTIALVGAPVALYAVSYFRNEPDSRFWLLWLVLLGGLNGVLFSANLLSVFLFLEVLGGAAVGMVALSGKRRALLASMRYFFARLPGSLSLFFGIALLYSIYGTLDLYELGGILDSSPLVSVAAALMLLGVVIKAAVFPLHFWLPPAHSCALGPASAVLSGVVVKVSFYVALRFWFDLFPAVSTVGAAQFLGCLGSAGILWGGIQALRARRLKMIIAHSTVSQMGFLFLLFPLFTGGMGTEWATTAWTGGLYQLVSHAMAKAALLMAAGVILYSLKSDAVVDMYGIATRLPVTTFTVALSCVTLIGLPPSGGFIAKWLILSAVIESGQWWWIVPLIGGAFLTASYTFLMLSYAFRTREEVSSVRPVSHLLSLPPLALALVAIVIGLRVQEPMRLIAPMAEEENVEWQDSSFEPPNAKPDAKLQTPNAQPSTHNSKW